MSEKTYEMENDYILDVLEEAEDKLTQQINENLPQSIKIQFAKFIAVRNAVENINVQNAFEKGLYSKVI